MRATYVELCFSSTNSQRKNVQIPEWAFGVYVSGGKSIQMQRILQKIDQISFERRKINEWEQILRQ